jgi:trimeric autotransporter adhesin
MIGRARAGVAGAVLAVASLAGGLVAAAPPASAAGSPVTTITTVAGGPGRGFARNVFQDPADVAAGPGGVVYEADSGISVVREFGISNPYERIAAGTWARGYSGDGGRATAAELFVPDGVAVDAAGNLVISDSLNYRVRVVAAKTGTFYGQAMTAGDIYTVAGDGTSGFSGDGGPATAAELNGSRGVAVDAAGNLVIADTGNERVRVVAAATGTFYGQAMTAGDIYTIAGTGHAGFSGDGGPATSAELNDPTRVAVDAAGNLVIADTFNGRVRVVAASTGTFYGQSMTAGDIYTVAGGGTGGLGDGGPATSAELEPEGVAVDAAGNLVIGDGGNARVRVVAATSGTFYGQAMTAGDIYTVAGTGRFGFSGDGGPAISAELGFPGSVAVDAAGNLVIADGGNYRVRVVAATSGTFYGQAMTAGDIYNVAGNGSSGFSGNRGPAVNAELTPPLPGVAVDAGNYVIAAGNQVRFVCETSGTYFRRVMTAGDIYPVAGTGRFGFSGDGGPAISAKLHAPQGVAVDAAGNLVIADTANDRVRVVAARSGRFYGQAMTAGDIYTVAGTGTRGFSGDGGPATSADLNDPVGVAVNAAGTLVIADTGYNEVAGNDRVRVVAARSGTFYGQAMTAGDIYTVAGDGITGFSGNGGPATSAELNEPQGVAVDAAGNVVIADTFNHQIRVVAARSGTFYGQAMTAGDIYAVAGDGTEGHSGDGGPATSAELNEPRGVAVDAARDLVIADTGNDRVQVVAARSGTLYGQAMTAGDIYTVAGTGTAKGSLGNGGPATSAVLFYPQAVAVGGSGNLLIADSGSSRVRLVSG